MTDRRFVNFDTISKATKKAEKTKTEIPPVKNNSLYYFYRSLKIVIVFWIIIVFVIVFEPYLDYWVKSNIKNSTGGQVLSQTTQNPEIASEVVQDKSQPITFYLKNSNLEISAPVVEGIAEENLKTGIGHHPESVWPDQKGNVVLAGHSTDLDAENPYAKVFFELRSVEISDEVVISYHGNKYHYQVFRKETVSAKDNSLFGLSDDWILTFYTCDPPYTDWKRLVFQAKLTKIE